MIILAAANDHPTPSTEQSRWSARVVYGKALAFGDDSWNLVHDLRQAQGDALSVELYRKMKPALSVGAGIGWSRLHNRVNLEVYNAYADAHPQLFPRKGFYGYDAFDAQLLANADICTLASGRQRKTAACLMAGAGIACFTGYDDIVNKWNGQHGFNYSVDTGTHVQPVISAGVSLGISISRQLSIILEMASTFTTDKMDGVDYEEWYDVYLTAKVGVAYSF